jgi:DNA replication protein DnaC
VSPPTKLGIGLHTNPDTCPDCGAPSLAAKLVVRDGDDAKPWIRQRCNACGKRVEAERDADRARAEREERAAQRLATLRIPPLYAGASLDAFELHGDDANRAKQARALQVSRRYLGTWPDVPLILIFLGVPGSGKGHVVWSLARSLCETHGAMVRVCVLSDVIRDLREAWGSRDEGDLSEAQRLARYRSSDLLVIDEVSRHAFYGQPQQHLYDLVAWREVQCKPTILTTNETGQSLAEFLGPALASRALGWGSPVDFGEADYRLRRGMRANVSSAASGVR